MKHKTKVEDGMVKRVTCFTTGEVQLPAEKNLIGPAYMHGKYNLFPINLPPNPE
jgi:hypothetical protein